MIVNQQVKVPFSIGTYKNEVNCDIVPMEAGHIDVAQCEACRPWIFFINGVLCFLKINYSGIGDGKKMIGDATSRRR